MPCFSPYDGWLAKVRNASGKRSVVFKLSEGEPSMPVQVPCGQCIGCRVSKARQWAVRCKHEASLHKENCFVTLTYNPENCPDE